MPYLVIPAYEPEQSLLTLLSGLKQNNTFHIIIVNDGSPSQYNTIFKEAASYGTILTHTYNKGKGAALKTAFSYIYKYGDASDIIVTADADGQHTLPDIVNIYHACQHNEDSIITGIRQFNGKVPLRSRFGNCITKYVFFSATRHWLSDTQCGLRAFCGSLLPFLCHVKGDRYEYEMNVLLEGAKKYPIKEVPIETVYVNDNASSHFHPVRDAILIYREIFKFAGTSLLSFLVDYVAYAILLLAFAFIPEAARLILANVFARLGSGTFNYLLNRHFVFEDTQNVSKTGGRYFLLALGILLANTCILLFLRKLGLQNLYILKIITELILFMISWTIQKHFIFKKA